MDHFKLRLSDEIRIVQIKIHDGHGTQYEACRKTIMILARCSKLSSSQPNGDLNPAKDMVYKIQWTLADCLL